MFSLYLTHSSFKALVEAAALLHHGAAGKEGDPSVEDHQLAERDILRKVQYDSFPNKQQIQFRFNPPSSPHFGAVKEREIRSIKSALYASLQGQSMTEKVLNTVLT